MTSTIQTDFPPLFRPGIDPWAGEKGFFQDSSEHCQFSVC